MGGLSVAAVELRAATVEGKFTRLGRFISSSMVTHESKVPFISLVHFSNKLEPIS